MSSHVLRVFYENISVNEIKFDTTKNSSSCRYNLLKRKTSFENEVKSISCCIIGVPMNEMNGNQVRLK